MQGGRAGGRGGGGRDRTEREPTHSAGRRQITCIVEPVSAETYDAAVAAQVRHSSGVLNRFDAEHAADVHLLCEIRIVMTASGAVVLSLGATEFASTVSVMAAGDGWITEVAIRDGHVGDDCVGNAVSTTLCAVTA